MSTATPGTSRTSTPAGKYPLPGYETTFIVKSEISDEGLKALQEKISGIASNYAGEAVLTEDWGKRKLAYPISKETRGHYIYMVYTGTGDVVHEVERNLRLSETVLRFMTINLEKEFEPDTFRKQRADVHAATKRREEEREARREERDRDFRRHAPSYDDGGRDDSDEG